MIKTETKNLMIKLLSLRSKLSVTMNSFADVYSMHELLLTIVGLIKLP